jgi:hypothetical protein
MGFELPEQVEHDGQQHVRFVCATALLLQPQNQLPLLCDPAPTILEVSSGFTQIRVPWVGLGLRGLPALVAAGDRPPCI